MAELIITRRARALDNARQFSKRWEQDHGREDQSAKTFWDELFTVFGLYRRQFATMEYRLPSGGIADLYWEGHLIVEHKSRGRDLKSAFLQAQKYADDLPADKRPKWILASDFAVIHKYKMNDVTRRYEKCRIIEVSHLADHYDDFDFFTGVSLPDVKPADPLNFQVTRKLGSIFDILAKDHYRTEHLPTLLTRLVFCMFAQHSGLFAKGAFTRFVEKSKDDGSDLGARLSDLFQVLNQHYDIRSSKLTDELREFPHVNGNLFADTIEISHMDAALRNTLLTCANAEWHLVSPAIFGALFQCVMDKKKRANLGEHYTSEQNILRVLQPLFLDGLRTRLGNILKKADPQRTRELKDFRSDISKIKILDPACGCGNFLVVAFRELRELDIQALIRINQSEVMTQQIIDLSWVGGVSIRNMYGLEISQFPSEIAKVALWMIDHLMNVRLSIALGRHFVRLPLDIQAQVACTNALKTDWRQFIGSGDAYVVGNPPFLGASKQSPVQKDDMKLVFGSYAKTGNLDYVGAWLLLAAKYKFTSALVATNSVSRGEQVPLLWNAIRAAAKEVFIAFAYETFKWNNDAPNVAQVHVVILGFASKKITKKRIFSTGTSDTSREVSDISPYIIEYDPLFSVQRRSNPLSHVPNMRCGSKIVDGGNLILSRKDKDELIDNAKPSIRPLLEKCIRRYSGTEELLYGQERYCLWMTQNDYIELSGIPEIKRRVNAVRDFRLKSNAEPTQKSAATPWRFFHVNQPCKRFIAIPEVSSENRTFFPVMVCEPDEVIISNKLYHVEYSDWLFGILSSSMHLAWIEGISGRLENRLQYAGTTAYNPFPFPQLADDDKKRLAVETAAKDVIAARSGKTLAYDYGEDSMPKQLKEAHYKLDKAVDAAYGKKFDNDSARIVFLLDEHRKRLAPLLKNTKGRKPR